MLTDGRFRSALLPDERLAIPREVIRPAIRRQSDLWRLTGSSSRAGSGVLYLMGWAVAEDADSGDWQLIDGDLADLIGVAARTIYQRGAVYRTVPELSAVRTNVGPGRFWYHLPPFTYRHEPDLFVARVNGGNPQPYLNGKYCGCVPRVIDANFSSIWADPAARSRLNPFVLVALLSSTWTRAILESLGTVMGGGALKLEATHLRRLLLPKVEYGDERCLTLLGEAIACQGLSVDTSYEVDRLVGQILCISEVKMSRLRRLALSLLEARTPRTRSRIGAVTRPSSPERLVNHALGWANHEDCLRKLRLPAALA